MTFENDSERYEVWALGTSGRRSALLATAATQAGARIAMRTLREEGERRRLAIRDVEAAGGRRRRPRRVG